MRGMRLSTFRWQPKPGVPQNDTQPGRAPATWMGGFRYCRVQAGDLPTVGAATPTPGGPPTRPGVIRPRRGEGVARFGEVLRRQNERGPRATTPSEQHGAPPPADLSIDLRRPVVARPD